MIKYFESVIIYKSKKGLNPYIQTIGLGLFDSL